VCGIAGAFGFVDEKVADAVRAMSQAQTHRGPDAGGFWRDDQANDSAGVALAHRRLAILDLSEAGVQPMHDASTGGCQITPSFA